MGLVIRSLSCKGLTSHWVGLSLPLAHQSRPALPDVNPTSLLVKVNDEQIPPFQSLLPDIPPPRA